MYRRIHALPALREALEDQLPEASNGSIGAWREVAATLMRRRHEPDYCIEPVLPPAVASGSGTTVS